jgi:hypothetical protein
MAQHAAVRRDEAAHQQIEKLEQTLSNLEIEVSVGTDGRFTVCTHSEPLFCFVRKTEEEIADVVADTLTSYVNTFYGDVIDSVEVRSKSIPLEISAIPVEELKPVSGIRPTFKFKDSQGRQVEFA